MPSYPLRFSVPIFWNLWGHSYFQHAFGPRNQSGRIDAFVRALIPTNYGDFANWAVTGARLSVEGQSQGGYARVINNILQSYSSTGASGPAVSTSGGHIFCYGINDLGNNTPPSSQYDAAYGHAARAVISRARMSWLRPNNWAGAAGTGVISYGAGFTSAATSGEFTTGLTVRSCTVTGATATVTLTLPSDYNGETIASLWIANPGVAGGTITKSGTAGVTGTFSTSNIMPVASINHSPVCDRIKGLTAANAGQTIIYTVTAIDASATVQFDSIWGESLAPPPVIWCNTARLTTTGYAAYGTPPTDAGVPGGVQGFNAIMPPIVAEFDSMVQIADLDGAFGKDPVALIADGLHPNELGGAQAADAIITALGNCTQGTSRYGVTANLQSPGPRYASVVRVTQPGQWYIPESPNQVAGTAYTPVLNDVFAVPFLITAGVMRITRWFVQLASSTVATNLWFAIYDDRAYSGYPQVKYTDTTPSSSLALTTGAGVKLSPTSANGSISQPVDPGLYWLVMQVGTAGTTTMVTQQGPSPYLPSATSAGLQTVAGYKLTGQPTGPLGKTFPAGATLVTAAPLIGIQF